MSQKTIDAQYILHRYETSPQVRALVSALSDDTLQNIFLQGLVGSAVPIFFAGVAQAMQRTALFVLSDTDEAGYFYHDLTQVMDAQRVLFFPSAYRRATKYGQRDAANEILRTEVLARVSGSASPIYIVTSPGALAELVVSKKQLNDQRLSLGVRQTIDLTTLRDRLIELGFKETDYVYEPGQFAIRGSIFDIFSYSSEFPFRIDFFGDEIDTIRTFSVQDQLSKHKCEQIEIVPELTKGDEEKVSLLRFLPADALLVCKDLKFVRDTIAKIYEEGFSSQALLDRLEGATEMEQQEIRREMMRESQLLRASQFMADAEQFRCIEFGHLPASEPQSILRFNTALQPLFHKNFTLLRQTLEDYRQRGYTICILADSLKQQQRLKEIIHQSSGETAETASEERYLTTTLHAGFIDNDLRTCFFTDHQIFDRFHKYSLRSDEARTGKIALTMKELMEMEHGDYLIHIDYGIGKFGGLVRVPTGNSYQEMIRIIYQHGDKVDVSIHSLYKISKYRRSNTDTPPALSVLGSGAWERLKERTKTRIKTLARDLIKLYARRRHEKGFAFSPDSFMQQELEASFLYEDTPDQLKATQEVKADMETAHPMDRLVCGDVGFGKTEVAVRAAFKAAADSKQVAVLVPTTILAYQHFQTFRERLKAFPVNIEYLTRARNTRDARRIIEELRNGHIDILIGTKKMLGADIAWHDLGLLIIDEEQKFGVAAKEKLRQLKNSVDTLTLSATPIPRTLQFSLMGARDMSIIRTPPPNRYPIHTEVQTYNSETIADAINFEMSRNGQIYFVSSRISSLPTIAHNIAQHVPDCRVGIAHGKMKPDELEHVIEKFMQFDYDVLLATSIIENGIDIPNANTIIINNAHRFGLSDLHQMRGRVGRSNRKAFCYLLAPPLSALPTDSRRRLEAIETFSELGSGFNLAMQDLDIRGAGNLLGTEQSGFMEELGYETYQKVLTQAVTELKNDELAEIYTNEMKYGREFTGADFVEDCSIETDLETYFPDTYVPGSSERMLLYRELDSTTDDDALEKFRQRMIDRFGPIPQQGEELMRIVTLRRLGRQLGCEKIILRQSRMTMQFVSNPQSAYYKSNTFESILNYVVANPRRCDLKETNGRRLMHVRNVASVEEAVQTLRYMKQKK